MDQIEQLSKDVAKNLRKPSLDPEVAASVRRHLREIGIDQYNVLRDDAYENFALSYLQREESKFRPDGTRPDVPGKRDAKLCHCKDSDCPLKRGELPVAVRNADGIDEGILAFKREHTGYPRVLDEVSDAWAAKCQLVEDALTAALVALNKDLTIQELPDDLVRRDDEMADEAGVQVV